MHFLLTTIQLIILTSSPTLANNYALPLHIVSRQSSFFCLPVFLEYPGTWTTCGNGYISPECSCCYGGLIGCLTVTQTCAFGATGVSICCDNNSPDCSSNTETTQRSDSLPSSTSKVTPTSTKSFNLETGSSTTTSAKTTTNIATETAISGPSSSVSSITTSAKTTKNDATSSTVSGASSTVSTSSSTQVNVVGAARGLHPFILQSAVPFIVMYCFLVVGIFS